MIGVLMEQIVRRNTSANPYVSATEHLDNTQTAITKQGVTVQREPQPKQKGYYTQRYFETASNNGQNRVATGEQSYTISNNLSIRFMGRRDSDPLKH